MVDFAIDTIGAHRLEARAAVQNGRGSGETRKRCAVPVGVPRSSFVKNSAYLDQAVWSILDSDRRQAKAVWGPKVH